nr:transposase (putative), gypsy type [Tanacetum cinerariifolium]
MFPVLSHMAMNILSVQATSVASEFVFSTSGRVLSIRRTRLTPASLEMCMCLKDHLDAQERKQDKSTLETLVDFEEEILDAEVQANEAIPLSDEEIALDAASSEGYMFGPGSGGEEAEAEANCGYDSSLRLCSDGLLAFGRGFRLGARGDTTYGQVRFVFLLLILFTLPFSPYHMSSGSQTFGDAIVLKFDMHVYTSVLTFDEVKNLVAESAIPLDLHPCVPPSGLTMNRLSADKIGGQGKIFNELCTSLKHLKDRFFLIVCRTIPDAMPWRHQDSTVTDPAPTGIHTEDVRRLCENVIDLRHVHPTMLYAVGHTTLWKHVGHHPILKMMKGMFPMVGGVRVGKGMALVTNKVIPQHTTPPLPFNSQILEKSYHQKVVEYENERVLWLKGKPKRPTIELLGRELLPKEFPSKQRRENGSFVFCSVRLRGRWLRYPSLYFASQHHHPNEVELTTGGGSLILKSVNRAEEDTEHCPENVEDTTETNSHLSNHSHRYQHSNPSGEDAHDIRDETAHTHASGSTGHVSSSSGGSHRQAFPRRNPSGSGIGSSLRGDTNLPVPFLSWFKLGRGALAQIDILQRYEALNEDYGELCESHRSCQGVSDRLTETKNQLLDAVRSQNQLSEDHQVLQQVHLGCVRKEADLTEKLAVVEKEMEDLQDKNREREERIKQLEADLAT